MQIGHCLITFFSLVFSTVDLYSDFLFSDGWISVLLFPESISKTVYVCARHADWNRHVHHVCYESGVYGGFGQRK